MITDDLLMYLLFQMILLMINVLGHKKFPLFSLFGILGAMILVIPTINAFGDYYMMAILLSVINIGFPTMTLANALR